MANPTSYTEHVGQVKRMMGALGKENPNVMGPFGQLHQGAMTTGALEQKVKELVALGIAIHAQCESCISFHTHDALKAGATRAEIIEVIGVAALMGGAPGVAHGIKALEALNEFEAQNK